MKETSHLFSILIISKPKGKLNLFISPTEAILLKLQNQSFCKRKGTKNKDFVLFRVNTMD